MRRRGSDRSGRPLVGRPGDETAFDKSGEETSMWKRVAAIAAAVAVLGVLAALSAVASGTRGEHKVAAASPPAGPAATPIRNASPAATASYWTAARRKAAKPMTLSRNVATGMAYGSANLDFARSRITPQTANKQPPYKGVGKLYFTEPGVGNFQCSASVISNRLVVTAGHCV